MDKNQCKYLISDNSKIQRCKIYNYCKQDECQCFEDQDEQIIPDVIINDHPYLEDVEQFSGEE